MKDFKLPLMDDNIDRHDVNELIEFLQQDPIPRLTNGPKVRELEQQWSENKTSINKYWVGYCYFNCIYLNTYN